MEVTFNDLPNVIYNIAIYADDTTLYSGHDQESDLWQQLQLASELESALRDIADWGRMLLVDFKARKTQLVSFDWSNDTGAIDVKMDWFVTEEKPSLQDAGIDFLSSKLDRDFIAKIGALIYSKKFLFPKVALHLYKSTIQPCMEYCCMSGLVLLVATWSCWTSYKNGYAGLLVLYLLPLLNPLSIVEILPS